MLTISTLIIPNFQTYLNNQKVYEFALMYITLFLKHLISNGGNFQESKKITIVSKHTLDLWESGKGLILVKVSTLNQWKFVFCAQG